MKRTHLPLNALRVFDAAARHLRFTRAADEPAVATGGVGPALPGMARCLGRVAAREWLDEMRGVPPTDRKHAVEFFQLPDADGAGKLERPDVVPGHHESIGLEERIVVLLPAVDDGVGRHVARPSVDHGVALGAFGRGEGLAAMAVVLVHRETA